MNGLDVVFVACAGLGGALFLAQFILQFMGHDTDADVGPHDPTLLTHDGGTADSSFKLLSFQGLTAFFMMFGLVGLAMHRQSGAGALGALVAGLLAGLAAVWAIGKLLSSMRKLQSTGTLDLRKAVGTPGEIYLTVPAGGTGKIQVTVQNHMSIFDAVSRDGTEISTGTAVRVAELRGANVMVVERI
jgi:membrane protein implicated in regulation of membrane protease activity